MTILQRKIQISWLGIVLLALSLFPAKRDAAQEMPDAALDINNFAELKILDPLQLAEKLAAISLPILENIDPELDSDVFVARLTDDDIARFVTDYTQNLQENELSELIDSEFQSFFSLYIKQMSTAEFASIYRQYLGQLTSDYLTNSLDIEFAEYVLSQILQLSTNQYSALFEDYVSTLWSYFTSSATRDELRELLGDDYEAILSTSDFSVSDPSFFRDFSDEIVGLSKTEFESAYIDYVTLMIGGLVNNPSILELPISASLETDGEPLDPSNENTNAGGMSEINLQPEFGSSVIQFPELTANESLDLLRFHIAAIARNYFIVPFKNDFIENSFDYISGATVEQITNIQNVPGISTLIEESRLSYNQSNLDKRSSIEILQDEAFLLEVTSALDLVNDIPYPNERLLGVAVNKALERFNPEFDDRDWDLSLEQYLILLEATFGLVEIRGADRETDLNDTTGNSDISWNFLGCGCDIDQSKVIYGFYPSWLFPDQGVPQEIDLRYYDRVAYYGMTLEANGEIDAGEYWVNGGAMNEFIIGAHNRMTEVDLAVYSPYWQLWDERHFSVVSTNIIDRLKLPLQYGAFTRFAKNYLLPIYPTATESIGREYMGDGLTLLFDNLEDPETLQVRDLVFIGRLIERLARDLQDEFGEDAPPINLMLNFHARNTSEVLRQFKTTIKGSQVNPNQYISRLLLFLEQDTWDSSQQLIDAVRTVFVDDDSDSVLEKLNPILIPAMDEEGRFSTLSRDLNGMRRIFGEAGGAAIWPIPVENSTQGRQIKEAFVSSMVIEDVGFWAGVEQGVESFYFRDRLFILFFLTFVYTVSILTLIWSVREPIRALFLLLAKIFAGLSFTFVMLTYVFVDPYVSIWRMMYFILPLAFVVFVVPMQNITPAAVTTMPGNKYMSRSLKRQRTRMLRGVRRSIRNAIWHRDAD